MQYSSFCSMVCIWASDIFTILWISLCERDMLWSQNVSLFCSFLNIVRLNLFTFCTRFSVYPFGQATVRFWSKRHSYLVDFCACFPPSIICEVSYAILYIASEIMVTVALCVGAYISVALLHFVGVVGYLMFCHNIYSGLMIWSSILWVIATRLSSFISNFYPKKI